MKEKRNLLAGAGLIGAFALCIIKYFDYPSRVDISKEYK